MSASAQAHALALAPLPLLRRMLGRPTPPAAATAAGPAGDVTRLLAIGVPARRTVALPRLHVPAVAHCRRGVLWITCDGELHDVILRAGESCPLQPRDGTMAHALHGDGVVELETRR